ncbi:hypothetical protein [Bradyrhizobium erythrophlei]|uniref:hypothetical protein n=1 Tax=Bradyrhizobium erythrophlei TaxID=1437360 RepID=UPI0012AB95B4|nr:hypothetical protein [Bradyrhizobium erythrophlei]
METELIVVGFRSAERLLVAGGGIVALVLGYRLFAQTESHDAAMEARVGKSYLLRLQRVGPGIFFALFGSALLAVVMYSNVDISFPTVQKTSTTPATVSNVHFGAETYGSATPQTRALLYARSLQILADAASFGNAPSNVEAQKSVSDAIQATNQLKEIFVDQVLGAGSFRLWQTAQSMEKLEAGYKQKLSEAQRNTIASVDRILQTGAP